MFTYKGRTSKEFYLRIEGGLTFSAPSRDINFVTVPGRDGSISIDNGRYEDVIKDFPATLRLPEGGDIEELLTELHDWLSTDHNYHTFLWSGDPNFAYRAMVHERYNTQRVLKNYGKTVLYFRFFPRKYLTESLEDRDINNGQVINNPYNLIAKPSITIYGTGDINMQIGTSELILQGIDGGCIVDSETETITSLDGQRTQFDKMFSYPFPSLSPGDNTITFEGADSVRMQTRVGALIT